LAKPVILGNAVYSTTSGVQLFNINIGPQLFTQSVWWDKLKGFKYIRATAVIRIVVNMSPFQAGSLLAHFSPCWNRAQTQFLGTDLSLIGKSQRPGARIDSCNGETILRFPYVAPNMYFDLSDPNINDVNLTRNYHWGRFVLESLTGLRTGVSSENTADVKLYLSWEDIDLQAPTYVVQSGNVQDVEVEAAQEGPVARAFAKGQTLAKALNGVPVLSTIAEPSWWFAGLGRSVANLFGWSKPNKGGDVSKMALMPTASSYNADGVDNSIPMSLLSSNKVEILKDIPGHDLDEMSIDFIKRQKAIVNTFIVTSTSSGTIATYDLQPNGFRQNVTVVHNGVNVVCTQPSPIAFLAGMFRYYRGSIKIKFNFVKTQYHAGTLAFAFAPNTDKASINNIDLSMIHAEHVDLRTTDSYEVTLPFVSNKLYLPVDSSYGRLYVYVVNPIRAPESVSSIIDIYVEVSGGDDLEFAVPRSALSCPVVPQSGLEYYVQSGIEEQQQSQDCVMLESTIGYSDLVLSDRAASYSIGEKVMSVLQFLKAFHKVNVRTTIASSLINSRDGGFNPFLTGSFNTRTVPLADTNLYLVGLTGDPYTYLSGAYAFRRGGVRLQFLIQPSTALSYVSLCRDSRPEGTNIGSVWWEVPVQNELTSSNLVPVSNAYPLLRKVVGQTLSNMGFAQVQIPYYSKCPLTLNAPPTYGGATWANFYPFDMPDVSVQYWNESLATSLTWNVQRSVADDFQFSYWIGAPLLAPVNGVG